MWTLRFFFCNSKLQKQHVVFLRFDSNILGAVAAAAATLFFGQEASITAVASGGPAIVASVRGGPADVSDGPSSTAGISGELSSVNGGPAGINVGPAGAAAISGGPAGAADVSGEPAGVSGGAVVTATVVCAVRQVLRWLKNSSFLTITFGQKLQW